MGRQGVLAERLRRGGGVRNAGRSWLGAAREIGLQRKVRDAYGRRIFRHLRRRLRLRLRVAGRGHHARTQNRREVGPGRRLHKPFYRERRLVEEHRARRYGKSRTRPQARHAAVNRWPSASR